MKGFQDRVGFIWSVADEILRDDFKRTRYPDVILPFTVLRRVDSVLEPTKDKVLDRYEALKGSLDNLYGPLAKTSGHFFYNVSPFPRLLEDPKNVGKNLRTYLNGFSEGMRVVLERFKLRNTIDQLEEKGLLYQTVQKFGAIHLPPHAVPNHGMGTIFEELLRKFNEQINENPGEHFTSREVIKLMVRLVLNGDAEMLKREGVVRSVYDPACRTGGMLSVAEDYVQEHINPASDVRLYGQETNDETYAVCVSDMLIKGDEDDTQNIKLRSSLSEDGHPERLRMQVGATVRGGYLRFKRQCVEQIPISDAPVVDRGAISELVRRCLDAKVMGGEEWEAEIDERVVALYGLSGGS